MFNLISVRLWHFKDGGSLKVKFFGHESTYSLGKHFKIFLRGISVHQKLGIFLENKVVQKLSLEKNVFPEKMVS